MDGKRLFDKNRDRFFSPSRILAVLSGLILSALLASCAILLPWESGQTAATGGERRAQDSGNAPPKSLIENYGSLPLRFEANHGQADRQAAFLTRGPGFALFLQPTGSVFFLHAPKEGEAPASQNASMTIQSLRMRMLGANAEAQLRGVHELTGKTNYLKGRNPERWLTGIPAYQEVIARDIYPGIDLRYHGDQRQLEYDFIVAPKADVETIRLAFQGVNESRIDARGDLILQIESGELKHKRPVIYQEIDGRRVAVAGGYKIITTGATGETVIGFEVAAYSRAYPLVIDPVLDYATYLGGEADDRGLAIAVDDAGSAYIVGNTYSTGFPVAFPLQGALTGSMDIFVAKLSPAGDQLIYATYLGGSGDEGLAENDDGQDEPGEDDEDDDEEEDADDDTGTDIAVDASGRVTLVGATNSSTDFPIYNAYQPAYGGGVSDAFVVSLTPEGDALEFSTYLGGANTDKGFGVALDAGGIYITGFTQSANFPVLDAAQAGYSGNKDAFVTKLTVDGADLLYSTFIGGGKADMAKAIAVDHLGQTTITGVTQSKTDFPLVNALQTVYGGGGRDAFVTRLAADGDTLVYSTYLGGNKKDKGRGIAVDSQGNAIVAGVTKSTSGFPLVNALQPVFGGGSDDGFISKLSTAGNALIFSTYLGGEKTDRIVSVTTDALDQIHVAGITKSQSGIPLVAAIQEQLNGTKRDISIASLSPAGDRVLFSTYLGGSQNDRARDLAVSPDGSLYLTGITRSASDFPVTNAYQPLFGGGARDAFVVKIRPDNRPPEFTSTPVTDALVGIPYSYAAQAADPDGDTLSFGLITAPAGMTIDNATGLIAWTPGTAGVFEVSAQVSDGNGGEAQQAFAITVTDPNLPPAIVSIPIVTAAVGDPYSYDVEAADPNGDVLTYSLSVAPAGMSIDGVTGVIVWTPTARGDYPVNVQVNDGRGGMDAQSFSITVPNRPPVIASLPVTGIEGGQTYNYDVEASDPDGDVLSYALISAPADMQIDGATGLIVWTAGPAGDYPIGIAVTDGNGGSAGQDFTLSVSPPNLPPVFHSAPLVTSLTDLLYEYQARAVDPEGAALSFALNEAPAGMGVDVVSGLIRWRPGAVGSYPVTLTVTDGDGNSAAQSFTLTIQDAVIPPDPSGQAPVAAGADSATFLDATAFLYSGADPIQTGVSPDTFHGESIAVIRGQVTDAAGLALPSVRITILDRPEYGQTYTRQDGGFDLAVNGGGRLTVNYQRPGFLPAQRTAEVPWRDYQALAPVVLIPLDPVATSIDLSNTAAFQVAHGSPVSDADGARQATVLFPAGTSAVMTLPDGSTQPLSTLTVRATEYTVGEAGPQAMPGLLPGNSGYTYAVELSVDEALAADATRVVFSQPLPVYVENFLDFPVGETVPLGWYDRKTARWVPADNGRILGILSVVDGAAVVDVNGEGLAATAAELTALGITSAELTQLALQYTPGQSLWRVAVTHFTPWDCNWPFGFPFGAIGPLNLLSLLLDLLQPDPAQCDAQCGSYLEAQTRTLGEQVPVTGTPFALVYRSDRMPGRRTEGALDIPLSGADVPADLKRIDLTLRIAGRVITERFTPAPNLAYAFLWDGLDAYGREQSSAEAVVDIEYVYSPVYYGARADFQQSFAQFGEASGSTSGEPLRVIGRRGSRDIKLNRRWTETLQRPAARVAQGGIGGWTLSAQHRYDAAAGEVIYGDGNRRSAASLYPVLETVAGNGLALNQPQAIAIAADGTRYIADSANHRVLRLDTQGNASVYAGTGTAGFSGDAGPAQTAQLNAPAGLALAPDGTLYIADSGNHRIRQITPDGIITTLAGTGIAGFSGDNGPAQDAQLNTPAGLALTTDNTLLIADRANHRIRAISPSGVIQTLAGSGGAPSGSEEGILATAAALASPSAIAVDQNGALYIADTGHHKIRRVRTNGLIDTVAGTGAPGNSGDGGPATTALLTSPEGIAVAADGTLYIADTGNHRIRRITQDGNITAYAGTGTAGSSPSTSAALAADLNQPLGLALGPDGNLYLADANNQRLARVLAPLPAYRDGEYQIPSGDGGALEIFNAEGRHLRSVDTLTGTVLSTLAYTPAGHLSTVTDRDGNVTTIEYDVNGNPSALVSPDHQRTTLTLDAAGYLATLTNPAGDAWQFQYDSGGLLTGFTNPRQQTTIPQYDALGRLESETDPLGGGWILSGAPGANSNTVTLTSAEGRNWQYQSTRTPTGATQMQSTAPDNTVTTTVNGPDYTTQIQAPGGMATETRLGPDPRFGLLAPLTAYSRLSTPAGLLRETRQSRSVLLSDPNDPLSLQSQTDTLTTNGRTTTSSYAAATRTWTATSPEGRQSVMRLDAQGRVIETETAGLAPVQYGYDPRGRLETLTQGSGADIRATQYHYYASGAQQGYLESVTDALGRQVSFSYDRAGRILQQTLPDLRTLTYQYDANGNLTALTPPGQPVHGFGYTEVDLEAGYTPPILPEVPNPTSSHTWNRDKDLTLLQAPSGADTAFQYGDTSGRLLRNESYTPGISVSAPPVDLRFTYDGTLPTGITWAGSISGTVGWTYNHDFVIQQQCVNATDCIDFDYDHDLLLIQAGELSLTRDPQHGLITATELLSGVNTLTTTQGYNPFGEVDSDTASYNTNTLYEVSYTRDPLGRITQKTETVEGLPTTTDYGYDLAGRLETVTTDGILTASYQYDANGNRTHVNGSLLGSYDAQDRLTQYGDSTYTYSANGELRAKTNTVTGETTAYHYDQDGNLHTVVLPGRTLSYLLDGQGRRVGKQINGTLQQGFLYQDQLNPIAELDGNGNVVSRFVYADKANVPSYMVKNGVTYRIVSDHLGSPRLVIDMTTGITVQRLDYDAFGNVLLDTNPGFQPFGFAGGIYDVDTGLVRFGARDYDPVTGRWTTKDPIRFDGGDTNLYGYVVNDPINFVDPTGMWAFDFNKFANQIEKNRFNLTATFGTLAATEAAGTMPKTPSELHGLGVPKKKLNPITSQVSRWSSRFGNRALREIGRSTAGITVGAVATGALIFEGFYDWGVIGKAAWDSLSFDNSVCEDN